MSQLAEVFTNEDNSTNNTMLCYSAFFKDSSRKISKWKILPLKIIEMSWLLKKCRKQKTQLQLSKKRQYFIRTRMKINKLINNIILAQRQHCSQNVCLQLKMKLFLVCEVIHEEKMTNRGEVEAIILIYFGQTQGNIGVLD